MELAHLDYQRSRLVRSWTHLERQRGGFGFLGGPGESQIETDRRLIQERIIRIERELEGVKRRRALHRARRDSAPYPVVALVGYTNAGKSTLFNRLTHAEIMAADMLFATLDPTLRLIRLPHGGSAILSDTVGFISNLPTTLISAFRATLEEVRVRTSSCTCATYPTPTAMRRAMTSMRSWPRLASPTAPIASLRSGTKSTASMPSARSALADEEIAGARRRSRSPRRLGRGSIACCRRSRTGLARGRSMVELTLDAGDGRGLHWLYEHAEVMSRRDEEARPASYGARSRPTRSSGSSDASRSPAIPCAPTRPGPPIADGSPLRWGNSPP